MEIRPYGPEDGQALVALTIDTFGPFYEKSFRPLLGEQVFHHQHGGWRDDYRTQVPALHRPEEGKHVAVAELDGEILGYVAWKADPDRRHGEIDILAVSATRRGAGLGKALCEHAFAALRALGVQMVEIGTGGDDFHAPARALYESLGCRPLPAVVYFKEL